MTVTIKVEGAIKTKRDKIECLLDVPDNWKPSFNEITKVIGSVRYLREKMAQTFTPPTDTN